MTVLAPGPPELENSLRECLALGADRVLRIWGSDWPREIPPSAAAFVLARVIRERNFDLVLCGENGGLLKRTRCRPGFPNVYRFPWSRLSRI